MSLRFEPSNIHVLYVTGAFCRFRSRCLDRLRARPSPVFRAMQILASPRLDAEFSGDRDKDSDAGLYSHSDDDASSDDIAATVLSNSNVNAVTDGD